jgi:Diguanylate cyclase, GGDEF domain
MISASRVDYPGGGGSRSDIDGRASSAGLPATVAVDDDDAERGLVADLLGRHFNDLTHLDDLAVGLEMFATLDGGAGREALHGRRRRRRERGRVDHGGARRTGPHRPLANSSGRPVGTTSLGEDITEKMLAQRALAHRATHDPLTGLANRALIEERLAEAPAGPAPVAVIVCDLDGYKRVNDRLGHAAGDEVLRAVAGRLRGVCRHRIWSAAPPATSS